MKMISKSKRILLRVDLNSGFSNGKVLESGRIIKHAETIKKLVKNENKVVILAHQDTKKGRISLKEHAKFLNKYVKVKFVNDIVGKKAINEIKKLNYGEALLLENIRFLKEEFKPSKNNKIVKILSPLFDLYINDAFSILHRNQTSIVSFQKVLPSYKGPILSEELKNLEKIKSKTKNCLFVLGGVKAKDLIPLIKYRNLSSGELASLTLIAQGRDLGAENKRWQTVKDKQIMKEIKKNLKNIIVPIDAAVEAKGKRKEIPMSDFPNKYFIFDIGQNTIDFYKKEIGKLKPNQAILFKGAPGKFEDKKFQKGTKEILNIIGKSKAFSIIAGGHSFDSLKELNIPKSKFNYVSLSGGALVKYISGEKLPGLQELK